MDERAKQIANTWKEHTYYDQAENCIDPFWLAPSIFARRFRELDLTSVAELACGHGRHVPRYLARAGKVRSCLH